MCVLLETRTDHAGLKEFMAHVTTHTAFDAPVTGRVGLPGQGVVILVRKCYVGMVNLWRTTSAGASYQAVWLRVDGRLFGVHGQVMLGGVYVPPKTNQRSDAEVGEAFSELFVHDLAVASRESSQLFVMGDFNASVGVRPEPFEPDSEPLLAFSGLAQPRLAHLDCSDRSPNRSPNRNLTRKTNVAGVCLLDMVAACDCILTTGRERGDVGQATCREATRPDHVFMSPTLFHKMRDVCVDPFLHGADHAPLSIRMPPPLLPRQQQHRCDHRCQRHHMLSWMPDRQQLFAQRILRSIEEWQQFDDAVKGIGPQSARLAAFMLSSIVDCAARDDGVAMIRHLPCPLRESNRSNLPPDPGWYDEECVAAREAYWAAAWNGASLSDRLSLHTAYKRVVRAKKRAHERSVADDFMEQLRRNPGKAVKGFTRRPRHDPSPISAADWHAHASSLFGGQGTAHPLTEDHAADAAAAIRSADFALPPLEHMEELVRGALQRLDADSGGGLDGIPAVFIKHAIYFTDPDDKEGQHVLAKPLARLFHKLLREGVTPDAWKIARLTPIHKKGDISLPGNYRMLAVSPVIYRLYAVCLNKILLEWCMDHKVLPDSQFGFIPGRNVQQAQFILRHVVQSQRQYGKPGEKRVWSVFVDFKQAYDSVDREALWLYLRKRVGVPEALLDAITSLYAQDAYVVVDGHEQSPLVSPTRGVKQGCPLSPLLFALFMNDIASVLDHGEGPALGVQLGGPSQEAAVPRLSHVLYADDLTLVDTSQARMQQLMDRLHTYAVRKGMVVNVDKCATLVFSHRPYTGPPVSYDGNPIADVSEFKYLGSLFTRTLHMEEAAKQCVSSMMKAWRIVVWDAKARGVATMPHVMLCLVQTYVLPRALFGCQLWGPDMVAKGDGYTSPSQKILLRLYKYILGVRRSVVSANLLDEVGAESLQHYWFKACVNFWSSAVHASKRNGLLEKVLSCELQLGRVQQRSWSGYMRRVLFDTCRVGGVRNDRVWWVEEAVARDKCNSMLGVGGQPCAINSMVVEAWDEAVWLRRYDAVAGDPLAAVVSHRVQATYLAYFYMPRKKGKRPLPAYLRAGHGLPRNVVKNMARFRLSSHMLRVEVARQVRPMVPYEQRFCARCVPLQGGDRHVDNELHVVSTCCSTAHLRQDARFASLPVQSVRALMQDQDSKTVALYIHKCMCIVDQAASSAVIVPAATQLANDMLSAVHDA